MEKFSLAAQKRQARGKAIKKLRADGKLPAVIYGHGKETETLELNATEFGRVFDQAGYNGILLVKIGDERAVNALIHEVQFSPLKRQPIHADLYRVKMDELIRTTVPLHFTGESTAVFQDGGSLMTNLEEVEVEALPANLPSNIEVDISKLDDFEKSISVADLKVPAEVKLLTEEQELVVRVEPPRSDEELEALDEEVGEAVPEGANEAEEGGEEAGEDDKPAEEAKE